MAKVDNTESNIEQLLQTGFETIVQAFELKNTTAQALVKDYKKQIAELENKITALMEENEIIKQENTFFKKENEMLRHQNMKLQTNKSSPNTTKKNKNKNYDLPVTKYYHTNYGMNEPLSLREENKIVDNEGAYTERQKEMKMCGDPRQNSFYNIETKISTLKTHLKHNKMGASNNPQNFVNQSNQYNRSISNTNINLSGINTNPASISKFSSIPRSQSMSRGNSLGHLGTNNNYMRNMFDSVPGINANMNQNMNIIANDTQSDMEGDNMNTEEHASLMTSLSSVSGKNYEESNNFLNQCKVNLSPSTFGKIVSIFQSYKDGLVTEGEVIGKTRNLIKENSNLVQLFDSLFSLN